MSRLFIHLIFHSQKILIKRFGNIKMRKPISWINKIIKNDINNNNNKMKKKTKILIIVTIERNTAAYTAECLFVVLFVLVRRE